MESAKQAFAKLGLTATREHNGVLFFVAVRERKFAVLGDSGINQKVPPGSGTTWWRRSESASSRRNSETDWWRDPDGRGATRGPFPAPG